MGYPVYPEMRDSGAPWLGEIPSHWKAKQIRRIFKIFNGATPKSGIQEFWDGDIVWITPEDLGNNDCKTISNSRRKLTDEGYLSCGTSMAQPGSLVISTRAPIGHLSITTTEACVNQGCRLLQVLEGDSSYWYYAGIAAKPTLVSQGQGSTFMELTRQSLAATKLPSPPLPEQQTIARFLDHKTAQIDALIAKKEALLQKLAEKRTALISQAVTQGLDPTVPMQDSGVAWLGKIPNHWETVRLGRKIMLQRGEDITKDEQTDGPVPVVSSGGISSFHNVPFAAGPGVIIGRKGTLGTVHYVETAYWPHDTTLWVKQFRGNIPRYVFYKLRAMNLASFDTGSANPTLNRNLLHPVVVSWPPIGEQQAIAIFLDHETDVISEMEVKVENAIDKLKEYRSALITAAVTGKIDVRGVPLPAEVSP